MSGEWALSHASIRQPVMEVFVFLLSTAIVTGNFLASLVHLLLLSYCLNCNICPILSWTQQFQNEVAVCSSHGKDIDGVTDCTEYINVCVERIAPFKSIRCFSNNKAWVTPDLKALLREKNLLNLFFHRFDPAPPSTQPSLASHNPKPATHPQMFAP